MSYVSLNSLYTPIPALYIQKISTFPLPYFACPENYLTAANVLACFALYAFIHEHNIILQQLGGTQSVYLPLLSTRTHNEFVYRYTYHASPLGLYHENDDDDDCAGPLRPFDFTSQSGTECRLLNDLLSSFWVGGRAQTSDRRTLILFCFDLSLFMALFIVACRSRRRACALCVYTTYTYIA